MPSVDPFSSFDYPFPLKLLRVTRGRMNQTTGEWVGETHVEEDLVGSFEPRPIDEDVRPFQYEGPVQNIGDARLHTDAVLTKGDRIKVALDKDGTSWVYYRVLAIMNNYALFGAKVGSPGRREYALQKEDEIDAAP